MRSRLRYLLPATAALTCSVSVGVSGAFLASTATLHRPVRSVAARIHCDSNRNRPQRFCLASSPNGTEGPSSSTFFDLDETVHGVHCTLPGDPQARPDAFSAFSNPAEQQFWDTFDAFVRIIPLVNPIVAYFSYESLAQAVDVLNTFLSGSNWVPVDGGAYQAKIIAPAINGVVVPAISILFATLISNTVSILRQRLLDVRTTINLEASDLRYLQTMIDSFPAQGVDQLKCRSYLIQYVSRVIAESQPGVKINALEPTGMDSEMNGMLAQLNGSLERGTIPDSIISETYGAITRLNTHRSKRISALQSTFPPLHYSIVTALAVSICLSFLIETNQELLIFLNSIQLRVLWTMLIGTFSALGVVCYDLRDVFGGSNQVATSVHQLFTIRSALIVSASMVSSKRQELECEDT